MYKNIGELIGLYRTKYFKTTRSEYYSQKSFVIDGNRKICTQSKLSDIENGRIKIPHPEYYDYFIRKLNRKSTDYDSVSLLYKKLINDLVRLIQYGIKDELEDLYTLYKSNFKKYSDTFYLAEINNIIEMSFTQIKGMQIPDKHFFDFYSESLDFFTEELQLLILNLLYIYIENHDHTKVAREFVFSKIQNIKLDCPLNFILRSSVNVRTRNLLIAQKILNEIDTTNLNNLMLFKIDRLKYMMNTSLISDIKEIENMTNPSEIYSEINRFELCRPFLHIASIYHSYQKYDKALLNYINSININESIVCLNLIYIFDCLFELNQLNFIERYFVASSKYIQNFSLLHNEIHTFLWNIYISNFNFSEVFSTSNLFEQLSFLNKQSPYIQIMRKNILNCAIKSRKYKLIIDFEKIVMK